LPSTSEDRKYDARPKNELELRRVAVAVALVGIVIALLVFVPFIPDRSAFCGSKYDCPIGSPAFNSPLPYVSVTYFVSGIGIIHNGAQFILAYTPWSCGTTYYADGVVAYGCNRGSAVL
jgi:hypothetical protein